MISPNRAPACSVPVFRYALERWPADTYLAVIFHRGALTEAQAKLAHDLEQEGLAGELFANLEVLRVDLDAPSSQEWLDLWQLHQTNALPALVLRYPRTAGIPVSAWAGPLTAATVKQVLDSPARRDIARRLVNGETAVWVLLESGDRERDEAAAIAVETRLKHLEETLEIEALDPADIASGLVAVEEEQLKVAFSTLRLSRTNAAEAVFIQMLLGTEEDLRGMLEPMTFPLFGRGRALFALVGKGIENANLDEACYFLTGPCSCQVKELNPGVDMLLAMNWDEEVFTASRAPQEAPALTSVAGFAEPEVVPGPTNSDVPASTATAPKPVAPPGKVLPAVVKASPTDLATERRRLSPLMTGVAVVGLLGLAVAAGASFWLLRRKP